MSPTAREMAEDPANPYKIRQIPEEEAQERFGEAPAGEPRASVLYAVLDRDSSEYGVYDLEGAEWWSAHLYWQYLQSESRAAALLSGRRNG